MNRGAWRFAVLLISIFAAATPALQESARSRDDKAGGGPAWSELMAGMEKMDAAMGSVAPSGDSDADFVRLMLPHHQAAIDMARTQLMYGKDPQMRRLAQEIITDQQSEIELMQLWLKQHGTKSRNANHPTPADGAGKEH